MATLDATLAAHMNAIARGVRNFEPQIFVHSNDSHIDFRPPDGVKLVAKDHSAVKAMKEKLKSLAAEGANFQVFIVDDILSEGEVITTFIEGTYLSNGEGYVAPYIKIDPHVVAGIASEAAAQEYADKLFSGFILPRLQRFADTDGKLPTPIFLIDYRFNEGGAVNQYFNGVTLAARWQESLKQLINDQQP